MRTTGSRRLFGRRVIYTEVTEINAGNIIDVLQKALFTHLANQADIDYLYRYYRGDQPILYRQKEVRPEINNTVVENRANEIVSFKTGYLVGEPVQYVSRGGEESVASEVLTLNDYMLSEDKPFKDKELVDWMHICGTSYRMVLPDALADVEEDEAPFEIFTLDPRFAFVVYSVGLGHKPMMGVRYVLKEDGALVFSCWTENRYFEVWNTWSVVHAEDQIFGIPIVEYPANNARLGAFEIVIPLLDAINMTESNRIDGVEQFVQALMLFHNVDISSEDFGKLKELGAIKYKDIDSTLKAEITYLNSELNQAQTQTLVDSMYETVLTICGMPNRNGGSSTSDTGSAVIMRDGWSAAEARAKDTEPVFKKSEKEFLKLVLRICRDMGQLSLKLSALEIRFTRRNYENIAQKASVLVTMLGCEKIAPELAFTHSGMFSDPQLAYRMSMDYMAEQEKKAAKLAAQNGGNGDGSGNQSKNQTDGGSGSGD
nr:MAG TPA: Portal [Caudoviricetes sp.]